MDLQGAQAQSRFRGIGRYSLSLAKAIARKAVEHEVLVVLNGSFPDTIEPIRAEFDGLIDRKNIVVWESLESVSALDCRNSDRKRCAQIIREAFIASLMPDVVHVSSLFEGLVDDAVSSIGSFKSDIPTAVTLYDLIPCIYPESYLSDDRVREWYEDKLGYLRLADMLLAISNSSRGEAINRLGINEESVVNISTAADDVFKSLEIEGSDAIQVRGKYGLSRPFVMYTGGLDPRKNIENLIMAYAALPQALRKSHQLAIVCAVQPGQRSDLEKQAKQCGLDREDVVFTGFVPESDLVFLYNLCELFVFPSWHEGFGLPVLEAMQCGAAVIGSNTSSIPEVIGRNDALFDPYSIDSIRSKMQQILSNKSFKKELSLHGLKKSAEFSWDKAAVLALAAFEKLHLQQSIKKKIIDMGIARKPILAYVSPLPPDRSGIADYSAEVLPGLAKYYQLIVVTKNDQIDNDWIHENCEIRNPEWLERNSHAVDRVLYHFGNSEFHEYMFELIKKVPGTIVLHDFFLSGIEAFRENHGVIPHAWTNALYQSHGYGAVRDRYMAPDVAEVIWRYPANLGVLQAAQGVIVHSDVSCRMATDWYGVGISDNWQVVPLLRIPPEKISKKEARERLGLRQEAFLVCSFGFLAPTKHNHRLLSAWCASSLARDSECMLLFVGENHTGEYGQRLKKEIDASGFADRIRIVGWTDLSDFRLYLAAADVGVQLRTLSRGETSAAVLDCLNNGLPTIVNANGSMADLPDDTVLKLPDCFDDGELTNALEILSNNDKLRSSLSQRALDYIREHHNLQYCADQYHTAIESFWAKSQSGVVGLLEALCDNSVTVQDDNELRAISVAVAANFRLPGKRQLLIDVSSLLHQRDELAIHQSVKKIIGDLIMSPPSGFRVEPIFATLQRSGYFYARKFTSRLLGVPESWGRDLPIDAYDGDVFLALESPPAIVSQERPFLDYLRNRGVEMCFVSCDLSSVSSSLCTGFSSRVKVQEAGDQFDKVICMSELSVNNLLAFLGLCGSTKEKI